MELNILRDDLWKDVKELLLFGYGKQGKKALETLKRDFKVIAIIDNDVSKTNVDFDGIPIIGFEEAVKLLQKYKVIVTTAEYYYREIKAQLRGIGLIENDDYVMYQSFIMEWYYKYKKKIYVPKTDITITSLCSLKCENCALFIPYWKNKISFETGQLKKDMDSFFRCVDFVLDMDIVGGEPFLYKELDELLTWCGRKYRNKIGYLGIITNGTIIPGDSTLDIIKEYNIGVSISDYSEFLGYEACVDDLCEKLQEKGIEFKRNTGIQWFDFGFPEKKYCFDEKSAKNHMESCNTICHCISDGRLYYCAVAWAAYKGGLYPYDPKGYVELSEIDENSLEEKKQILDYCRGNIRGDYLEFCKVCGGFGIDNKNRVKTAVQIK